MNAWKVTWWDGCSLRETISRLVTPAAFGKDSCMNQTRIAMAVHHACQLIGQQWRAENISKGKS